MRRVIMSAAGSITSMNSDEPTLFVNRSVPPAVHRRVPVLTGDDEIGEHLLDVLRDQARLAVPTEAALRKRLAPPGERHRPQRGDAGEDVVVGPHLAA